MVGLVVAIVHANVHHGGQSAAKPGRKTAFVQGDILDGVRVEYGEKTEQVIDVVYGDTVEQEQVFIGTTASYVHAG
ncbi:MAG: hypothetical protein BWY72_01905 [Bacteroidetes bacterium ADurb.Bin416]|nr:MAG: hypothetical protein BWY72_01905 [Bacteroidetes bacterium ADurb.Bin416]